MKEVAKSILRGNPKMHMLILLIDERPEEVTDIKEAIHGDNVYQTKAVDDTAANEATTANTTNAASDGQVARSIAIPLLS